VLQVAGHDEVVGQHPRDDGGNPAVRQVPLAPGAKMDPDAKGVMRETDEMGMIADVVGDAKM
jgi:hypothetical protein